MIYLAVTHAAENVWFSSVFFFIYLRAIINSRVRPIGIFMTPHVGLA